MLAIYKRELKAYLHSFIGALFIGATLFMFGIYFSVYNLFVGYPFIGYAVSAILFVLLISIPILTMRILAEERHQKTDQLILTSPVSVGKIVIGKFLAVSTVFVIPIVIICIYPIILSAFGTVAYGESYLAIAAFFLYGLACIAICMFVSSITESQVIAAVFSFVLLFLAYIMTGICNMISTTGNLLTNILSAFDMSKRFDMLMNGSLELGSLVYYLLLIVVFLVFTVQSIQKRRYQISKKTISLGSYSSGVIVITIVLAVLVNLIIAELPVKYTTFDLTTNKLYSITEQTEKVLSELDEEVNIYVIIDEEQADATLDATLKKYEGYTSNIKVTYVNPAVNPKFHTQYTDEAITTNSIIVEGNKRSKVIDFVDIYEYEMDYSTYTSSVTGYDGEGQLTSAIAYVTTEDMPKMYFIEGHNELSLDSSFTSTLEKENVDFETINLMDYDTIPEDAACVVVNAPTADFSTDDADKMLTYMENGGNVILITTYTEAEMSNFEKLLDFYGVSATKGLIVETDINAYYQDPYYLLPTIAYDTVTESVYNNGNYVFVPYAKGLIAEEREDVTVTTLLSSSKDSFVRNDFNIGIDYSKMEGDEEGSFAIGLKCKKAVGDTESTGFVYSSENIFTENADVMVAGNNTKLFTGTIGSFISHTGSVSVPIKNYDLSYLTIPQGTIVAMTLITVVLIPFTIMIGGFIIWFRRRKK